MGLRKFLVVTALAVTIMLLVVVWLSPSTEDFQTDNPAWNGVQSTVGGHAVKLLPSLSSLAASPPAATLILIPYRDFTPGELEQLKVFVSRGGTLVLADDYGYGNRVLQYLGLRVRFAGQALLDPIANYKNKWLPSITQLKASPLTGGVSQLTLNHATCLLDAGTGDALALSSPFSFLDLDGSNLWNEGEPYGPLPVAIEYTLGAGRLILVADPSLFINSMAVMPGNQRFIQNLAAASPALMIDRSHLPSSDLRDGVKNLMGQALGYLVTPAGTLGLMALALAVILRPIWRTQPQAKGDGSDDTAE